MLDIGTGSGILAITAIKLGAESAAGLDTDPCSLYEARANAVINGLEDKFHICGCDLGDINESFDLIAANLRSARGLGRLFGDKKRGSFGFD